MAEKNQQPMTQQSHFGARLKAARESLHLTEKDAAGRLHLHPRIIIAMENQDVENALPVTFMRGYLRSYARMLNFSDQEVNSVLEELGLGVPASTSLTAPILHLTKVQEDRYTPWITFFIVTGLLILVGMWWNSHLRSPEKYLQTTQPETVPVENSTVANPPSPEPSFPAQIPLPNEASMNSITNNPLPPFTAKPDNSAQITPTSPPKTMMNVSGMPMALPEPGLETNDRYADNTNGDDDDNSY